VPLEAGAGPENPPCPACGEPLFGWLSPQSSRHGPVSRCESCGLGVVGDPGQADEALRELDRLATEAGTRIANRTGYAASLGSAGWAGLEPGARFLFTIESVRRLIARRDQVVASSRWAPAAGLAATWQTMLNSVTFGHNVALAALGRGKAAPAKHRRQRWIDALATVVLAIPALLIAIPVELAGGLSGRGAVLTLRFELL
jgi:NADH:ubiquinone oxidoreductase subunit 5 (subunit L)/multisubunit Na+/H+ antiporter MnhA subunit/predicted RNA-binding Zn-ribbon protein involved in translation (DUF1610 family)